MSIKGTDRTGRCPFIHCVFICNLVMRLFRRPGKWLMAVLVSLPVIGLHALLEPPRSVLETFIGSDWVLFFSSIGHSRQYPLCPVNHSI
jgi:hypothetical protein